MAVFTGTANNDNFVGDPGVADTFNFTFANLSGADTVNGGTGDGDILRLTTTGTVLAPMLSNKSGLEQINLSAAGNDLVLDSVFLFANGGRFTILGNNIGNAVSIFSTSGMEVTYRAFGGGDTVTGSAGNETIEASGQLFGGLGDGDDSIKLTNLAAMGGTLTGGSGTDTITLTVGGAWNLQSYAGFEEIVLSKATTLTMAAEIGQRVEGSALRDYITLGAAKQTVHADSGEDEVRINAQTLKGSFLSGGLGARDTLVLTEVGTYALGQGNIVTGFERLVVDGPSPGLTFVTVSAGISEIILRSAGNVSLNFGTPGQSLRGSRFGDTVVLNAAGQVVEMGGGGDVINVQNVEVLRGGAMASGGRGEDLMQLLNGSGRLDFNTLSVIGIERLRLFTALEVIANDEVTQIEGSSGNDTLRGGAATVSILAGAGEDTIILGTQGGVVDGGLGGNTFILRSADLAGFAANPTQLIGSTGANQRNTLQIGQSGESGATATLDFNLIQASGIDQIVFASTSTARLIVTNALAATADGNSGGVFGDLHIFATVSQTQGLNLDGSTLTSGNSIRVSSGMPSLFDGSDTILGGAEGDVVVAGAGNDLVDLGGGGDFVNGEAGNDSLTAGSGNDLVNGGTGNDTLVAGAGSDDLVGGSGGDLIVLSADAELDSVRFIEATDGTVDLDTVGVTEAQADRITGYELASDQFVFNRAGLGLSAGGVVRVAQNGAWNPATAAVFVMESLDTIIGNSFASTAAFAGLNVDNPATVPGVATSVIVFVSNSEASALRRTGIYQWSDDGDGLIEASDTIRLLGVIDGIATNQLVLANILFG